MLTFSFFKFYFASKRFENANKEVANTLTARSTNCDILTVKIWQRTRHSCQSMRTILEIASALQCLVLA